jgi:hypothetical protein
MEAPNKNQDRQISVKHRDLPKAQTGPHPTTGLGHSLHDFLELSNGDKFYFQDPRTFSIECIAHSLSMACRFACQCNTFYSVAQHSVLVSHIMEKDGGDPLEGLLHDVGEFVMGDQATPLKYRLPQFREMEQLIERRAREFFNLPPAKTVECQIADKTAMFLEAWHLIPSQGATFDDIINIREQALTRLDEFDHLLHPMGPRAAEREFLLRYGEVMYR